MSFSHLRSFFKLLSLALCLPLVFCTQVLSSQDRPNLSDAERLAFIQERFSKNTGFSMTTTLPVIQEQLYSRDLEFIRAAVMERENSDGYLRMLNGFDREVMNALKTQGLEGMSMQHYNYAAWMWTRILSCTPDTIDRFLEEKADFASHTGEVIFLHNGSMKIESKSMRDHIEDLIPAKHIMMPIVSKTGFAYIPIMNKARGFFTSPTSAKSVDFLGVGTDTKLSFDEKRNQTAFELWDHDFMNHCFNFGRAYADADRSEDLFNARLYDAIHKNHSGANLAKIELACFNALHEVGINKDLEKYCQTRINDITEELRWPTFDLSGHYNIEQFESEIAGAESLDLDVPPSQNPRIKCDNVIIRKYYTYLEHQMDGYKLLKIQAPIFDSAPIL